MPPQIVESNGVENLSTGYVADEWWVWIPDSPFLEWKEK
jgi:hypothetical protein